MAKLSIPPPPTSPPSSQRHPQRESPPPSFSPNMREEISLYNVIYCSHHREVNSVSKVPTFLRCFTSHDFNDTFFFALYLVLLLSTPRRPSLLSCCTLSSSTSDRSHFLFQKPVAFLFVSILFWVLFLSTITTNSELENR